MAAPDSITIKNLNGDFIMNKKLSDPFEPILQLQGIGWVTRKAIGVATITLQIKQYDDDKGVTHIDIDQIATGGVKGTSEKRHLDNQEGEHDDHVFGKVRGRSRYIKISEVEDPDLTKDWLPETLEGEAVESNVDSVGGGWTAKQIWGFQSIGGERRYCRNVVVTKGSERKTARLIYDFVK